MSSLCGFPKIFLGGKEPLVLKFLQQFDSAALGASEYLGHSTDSDNETRSVTHEPPNIPRRNTRTLFVETNAGGRAASALLSVAAMDYIFHVQNVAVVHHSFCGTTTYTPELFVKKFDNRHHADISTLFDRESVAIMDYEKSLRYYVGLLRSNPAVPKNVKLYGFFFDINSGKLTEIVQDIR